MGDYSNLGKYQSIEEGFTHFKSSSKGRLVLQKIHFGKFIYDEGETKNFLEKLPEGATGIVLKRKFPKASEEEYYSEYIYSAWIYCEKEEVEGETVFVLDLDRTIFEHTLLLDWKGNQKNIEPDSEIKLSSTPIFLIQNTGDYPDINYQEEEGSGSSQSFIESKYYLLLLFCIWLL
jgi:hypothetical protein